MSEQVVIITGAGRGIGRAIALELARRATSLCLAARTREELEETRRLSGLAPRHALVVPLDLAQPQAPHELAGAAMNHFGRIDVLVNNAGWAPPRKPLIDCSEAELDRMLALNLRAPIALARICAREMIRMGRGGAIVNIASVAALRAPAKEAVYAASKAGLIAFTRASFAELRSYGIKVAAVVPGLVNTSLIPLNRTLDRDRMLSPESVAAVVMQILDAPLGLCPLETTLEPQYEPMRSGVHRDERQS
jgi:3-oxoacyl-[acyl-carrier protein] reductase